jgi:cob(I)alamin adenosyltransferase
LSKGTRIIAKIINKLDNLINDNRKIFMVFLNKIYTKTGDGGSTFINGGERCSKASFRIEAIGNVDEVNCSIGLIIAENGLDQEIKSILLNIQNDLFDLGADLCTVKIKEGDLRIVERQVQFLEDCIDKYNVKLSPLKSFVLPSGSKIASSFHLARAITRRAERSLVKLNEESEINKFIIQYINRLSDLLFVLSRISNNNGLDDVLWVAGKNLNS